MEEIYSVAFYGKTVPGYDMLAARRQFQVLLKRSDEVMEQVFSGRRVGLRKGLNARQAERYLLFLRGIGIEVEIEPPLPSKAPEPYLGPVPPLPPMESIVCPHCGEKQPRRSLCRVCSTDMPRMLAAQRAEVAAVRRAMEPAGGGAGSRAAGVKAVAARKGRRERNQDADSDLALEERDSTSSGLGGRLGRWMRRLRVGS